MSAKGPEPFLKRLKELRNRYRVHAIATVAVVATILLIVAQIVPAVGQYIFTNTIIPYITLLVVLDLALAFDARRDDVSSRFRVNQDESLDELLSAVRGCHQADLLEYAGATTLPLIRCIKRENVPLRLLVKHPDTVDGLQRQRTITTLDTLYASVFKGHTGQFEIRCYRLPYSVRGRHLQGRIVELGWLTPDPERQTAFGHANPSVLVEVSGGRKYLKEFFERTFEMYWSHQDTEDGFAVLQRAQASSMKKRRSTSPIVSG